MSAWFKGRKSGRALATLDAAGSEFTAAGGVVGAAGAASVCVAGGGGAGISEFGSFRWQPTASIAVAQISSALNRHLRPGGSKTGRQKLEDIFISETKAIHSA